MADRTIMNAKDAVSASLAECFVTIGDNRYNFMQAINLEANFEKNKTEVPILGKTGKGNKATGWKGTGSATFHYNTSIFRELMKRYDLYLGKLAVACTVFPNLNDKELQDSYKVMGADALLKTMLTPGEYAEYLTKIQEVCGFDTTMQDEVDEAKN